jgi:hypothetical protein
LIYDESIYLIFLRNKEGKLVFTSNSVFIGENTALLKTIPFILFDAISFVVCPAPFTQQADRTSQKWEASGQAKRGSGKHYPKARV